MERAHRHHSAERHSVAGRRCAGHRLQAGHRSCGERQPEAERAVRRRICPDHDRPARAVLPPYPADR
ncbi:hypothetical protein D3C76_1811510 [compost metagenome]